MLQSVDIFFDVPPYKQYNLQLVTLSQHHDSSVISRFTLQLNCLDTYRVFIFFYTGYNLCSRIQMEKLVLLTIFLRSFENTSFVCSIENYRNLFLEYLR